jgi:hypothetical protein
MQIGKRERVMDLRSIWQKETDFSNWLVTEEGLQLIAEDIGLQIEEPRRECRPGDFPCDIVGQLAGDENHVVIVENQFGKTDHDHLGKLLTYASVNTAATAIWISEEVSDDHRQVIDWLNDNTPPHLSFYLAQIKAYRIGESPVAPQLDVVCRPNLEVKVQRTESGQEFKERHIWRKEFWGEILSYIKERNPPFNVQRPGVDHWTSIAIGRSGFSLALLLVPRNQCITCELNFTIPWKESAFAQLHSQKAAIEHEIGSELEWLLLPGKKSARIQLKGDINPKVDANREQVKIWMNQQANAFYHAFRPRVQNLVAGEFAGSGGDEDDLAADD